jgi:hypothetical protein
VSAPDSARPDAALRRNSELCRPPHPSNHRARYARFCLLLQACPAPTAERLPAPGRGRHDVGLLQCPEHRPGRRRQAAVAPTTERRPQAPHPLAPHATSDRPCGLLSADLRPGQQGRAPDGRSTARGLLERLLGRTRSCHVHCEWAYWWQRLRVSCVLLSISWSCVWRPAWSAVLR